MESPLPANQADPSDVQKILKALSHQADIALNMMVGLGESRLEIQPVPLDYLNRTWDYTGMVHTVGALKVTVGCGLSLADAQYLSAHMLGMDITDEELVLGCLQELLNVVLGGAIGRICEVSPVRMGLPRMGRASQLRDGPGPDAGEPPDTSVILHLACSDVHLDLYVSIDGTPCDA